MSLLPSKCSLLSVKYNLLSSKYIILSSKYNLLPKKNAICLCPENSLFLADAQKYNSRVEYVYFRVSQIFTRQMLFPLLCIEIWPTLYSFKKLTKKIDLFVHLMLIYHNSRYFRILTSNFGLTQRCVFSSVMIPVLLLPASKILPNISFQFHQIRTWVIFPQISN